MVLFKKKICFYKPLLRGYTCKRHKCAAVRALYEIIKYPHDETLMIQIANDISNLYIHSEYTYNCILLIHFLKSTHSCKYI